MRADRLIRILLATVVALMLGVPASMGQTEGPLKIKRPTRRPPSTSRRPAPPPEPEEPDWDEGPAEEERPRLVRKRSTEPQPAARAASEQGEGPCPAGYIAVPVFSRGDERPPRLSRSGAPVAEEPEEEQEFECIFSETVVDEDGRVIEQRSATQKFSDDPFIEAAREKVFSFSSGLPNFICDQLTLRQYSNTNPPNWKLRDRIEAEVLYLNGKEEYQNIRRNGKKVRNPESSGAWSTGEFGTVMLDIFHPTSAAKFNFARDSEIDGFEARVYKYNVEQANSHWRVHIEEYEIYPAYEGEIWIDAETRRVLRIEMIAKGIPKDFSLDQIELAVTYGYTRISGKEYLLPTGSRNLGCRRFSRNCTLNEIEFRNYRKFATESTIMQTDSSITFDGEEDPPKP